jgi:hypothetical protein
VRRKVSLPGLGHMLLWHRPGSQEAEGSYALFYLYVRFFAGRQLYVSSAWPLQCAACVTSPIS